MDQIQPSKSSAPVRPRWVFLASVVIYIIYALLLKALGEDSFIVTAFGVAGGIFLVWGIVATIRQKRF